MSADATRPVLRPIHYQSAAVAGLAMIFGGQLLQGIDVPNYLVAVTGLAVLVTRRPQAPLVFLLVLTGVQVMYAMQRLRYEPDPTASVSILAPRDVLLSAGALVFLGSLYRLQALRTHIVPPEPRQSPLRGAAHPELPVTRPVSSLRAEELAGFLFAVPVFVLAGQALWLLLQHPVIDLPFDQGFVRVALLIWLVVFGLVTAGGAFSYWRRSQADPETARLYLQEVVWQELGRDLSRVGRWLAWAKRRRK